MKNVKFIGNQPYFSGLLSTWSSDLNINLKNGERYDDFDVSGDDAVGNDAQDDFDDAFDNGY